MGCGPAAEDYPWILWMVGRASLSSSCVGLYDIMTWNDAYLRSPLRPLSLHIVLAHAAFNPWLV
jgi:hypothetical protein